MSQPNRTYKRLEALFTETQPVKPDAPWSALPKFRSGEDPAEGKGMPQDRAAGPAAETVDKASVSADGSAQATFPIPPSAASATAGKARFPRLAVLWEKLTGAHPKITDVAERQQAQLAAAISLGLGVVLLMGFAAAAIANAGFQMSTIFILVMAIIVLTAYAVVRSPYPRIGSAMLVIGWMLTGYGLAFSNPSNASMSLYEILPIGLIAGSLLLPIRGLVALTGVNFLLVGYGLQVFIPVYSRGYIDSGIFLSLGVLLSIAVAYRNSIERLRVAEVNEVNKELRSFQTSLEQRVQDRTFDLELASEVGRTIAEKTADLEEMLNEAVELIRSRFSLYYTQVYLLDPSGRTLVLQAGTGDAGRQLLHRGHRLLVGPGSLNGRAVAEKRPFIVADTAQSADFLPNPLLPKTRSEMAVPLIAAGRALGVLDMQSEIPEALSEAHLAAFQALAGQLSIAIQNAGLFAESIEAREQMEANLRRSTESGWREFLNGIQHRQKIGFMYDQNTVSPLERKSGDLPEGALKVPLTITGTAVGELQATGKEQGFTPQETEIVNAAAAQLAQHIENLRLLDQAEQYRLEAEQAVQRLTQEGWEAYQQARSEMGGGYLFDLNQVRPLNGHGTDGDESTAIRQLTVRNESIGTLAVDDDTLSEETAEILDAVANRLSAHLENLRLMEQNEKRAREMGIVAELSTTTSTVLDPERLLQAIVDLAKERFGVYHVHVYLADETLQSLQLAAGAGEVGRKMTAEKHAIPMDAEKSLVARVHRERKALIVNDVAGEPDFLPNPNLPETHSEMAVPMIVGERVLGVFDVQSDRVNGFSEEDANIYSTLASQIAVALQNARLYAEQAATVTQLRELDSLKTSFLANMSHELRTPLNSILGFTDVMLEELDGPLTENMDNDLHLIQKNGQHLLHLINNVLDMAKIAAGKMDLDLERFKVQDLLDEVLNIASPLAQEKKLSLAVERGSDRKAEILADRTRIRQVLLNLVGNAVKFTDKGKVRIRTEQKDDKVLIRVSDTGMGIPPDQLDQVFQEFTQVDTSLTRKVGGTGLGLPISLNLVKMHGGRLWAESAGVPGKGSTFYVEMPLEAKIIEPTESEEPEHVAA